MKQHIKFILFIAFALTSCEKEIKMDIPSHTSKLAISGACVAGEAIQLQVSKSIDILEKPGKNRMISNASALLYENDQLIETMKYDAQTEIYQSSTIAAPGKTYRIDISAPGYTSITAEARTPVRVNIDKLQRISKARSDANGDPQDELRITFTDPSTAGDFYIIKIQQAPALDTGKGVIECVNTIDASVESVYADDIDLNSCLSANGIFLKDILFNGKSKELLLYVSSRALEPADMAGIKFYPVIELYHVSEDWYKFAKSYQYAIDNNGNPFSEPTNVFGNVKNGYGIFSVISVDSEEIK